VRLRSRSVAGICLAFALQALCNYAQQAWLPTFFVRMHNFSLRRAGLTLGLLSLATGLLGAFWGGYSDPQMVGRSLAWTVGGASLASVLLFAATFRPYRRDYAAIHGGAG
jgi:hypothetical protein